jgi:LysR family transcriptional regulator, benzoate and cis,cis-muconate-responsive activator of ben and cat genes
MMVSVGNEVRITEGRLPAQCRLFALAHTFGNRWSLRMELRHLRYFAAVAAHGSFNRAAINLHLTQPALSRQVKDLEDELDVPLFVRGKNAVTLTAAGEVFYEEARDLLARADQAIQRVRGEARNEILRVGYAPSLTTGIMPGALEKFQTATPRVRIELADLSPREMVEQAKEGRLDLLIAPGGFESDLPAFQWTELRRMTMVLVMPAMHPLAKLTKITPARLRDLPLVGLGRDNFPEYAPRVRAILKPFGVVPRFVSLVKDGLSALFVALEANNAAALLADGIECVMPRSLVVRPFSPALPEIAVMMGLPAVRPNPHAETFGRLLRKQPDRGKTSRI